jgi:hypothetical protein
VAHTSNPIYSGSSDQEGQCSKSTWANSLQDPISKTKQTNKKHPLQKRAGGVAQGVGPDFKTQYCKKKKKVSYSSIQPFNKYFLSTYCVPGLVQEIQ